jgi:hypothetical protein
MDDYEQIDRREFERLLPDGKGILGELRVLERRKDGVCKGVVTFFIEAGPTSLVRGTELFNEMMDFFGADADTIHGVWRVSPQGKASTNIDKVNELTSQGMSLEKAIQHAWTATRARKRGFGGAVVLGMPVGIAGNFVAIDVEMRREP